MEPPITFYSFSIINKTDKPIIIESKTIKDKYISYDTITTSQRFYKRIRKVQCFYEYKDTLISSFFELLKVRPYGKVLILDAHKTDNWVLKADSLSNGKCKGGACDYILIIKKSDLK